MEPFEIVAATASLVQICTSVVKTLHNLRETYKHSRIILTSVIDQCENIQIAWSRIEDWAKRQPARVDGSTEPVLDRLQRSIASGHDIMAALERDLEGARRKQGRLTVMRRLSVVWNEKGLRDHQERMSRQVEALTLLLAVLTLPLDGDRIELLAERGSVLTALDDSASSIAPSRVFTDSDQSSTRTTNSIRSSIRRMVFFPFEDDLLASPVYQRDSNPPLDVQVEAMAANNRISDSYADDAVSVSSPGSASRRQSSSRRTSRRTSRVANGSLSIRRDSGNVSLETSRGVANERGGCDGHESESIQHSPDTIEEQEPTYLPDMPQLTLDITYRASETSWSLLREREKSKLLQAIESEDLEGGVECLVNGVDIADLFQHSDDIAVSRKAEFLNHLLIYDAELFTIAMRRLAYTAGGTWMQSLRRLCSSSLGHDADDTHAVIWPGIEQAATFADTARAQVQNTHPLSAIQLACASGDEAVLEYLICTGTSPWPNPNLWNPNSPLHLPSTNQHLDDPLSLAAMQHSSPRTLSLLLDSPFAPRTHQGPVQALYLYLNPTFTHWSKTARLAQGWTPDWDAAAQIPAHLGYCADTRLHNVASSRGCYIAFLHAAMHSIHIAGVPRRWRGPLLAALLPAPDGEFLGCYVEGDGLVRVTPLALAARLEECEMVDVLLREGVRGFGASVNVWRGVGGRGDRERRIAVLRALQGVEGEVGWDARARGWFEGMKDRYYVSRGAARVGVLMGAAPIY